MARSNRLSTRFASIAREREAAENAMAKSHGWFLRWPLSQNADASFARSSASLLASIAAPSDSSEAAPIAARSTRTEVSELAEAAPEMSDASMGYAHRPCPWAVVSMMVLITQNTSVRDEEAAAFPRGSRRTQT